MAVPKKRTGHSAQGHRRSNWKATKPETTKCPNCGATVLMHTVCTECGTYKGKPVSLKDKAAEVVKEDKKAKKAEKKAEKTEEKAAEKTEKKAKKAEAKTSEVKAEKTVEEKAEKTEE